MTWTIVLAVQITLITPELATFPVLSIKLFGQTDKASMSLVRYHSSAMYT